MKVRFGDEMKSNHRRDRCVRPERDHLESICDSLSRENLCNLQDLFPKLMLWKFGKPICDLRIGLLSYSTSGLALQCLEVDIHHVFPPSYGCRDTSIKLRNRDWSRPLQHIRKRSNLSVGIEWESPIHRKTYCWNTLRRGVPLMVSFLGTPRHSGNRGMRPLNLCEHKIIFGFG